MKELGEKNHMGKEMDHVKVNESCVKNHRKIVMNLMQ